MRKYNILLGVATFLIAMAQFVVNVNACGYIAHETEIPEALK